MRDRLQEIVVAEHSGPDSVGLIDETSMVKKGSKTPGVQRQWCGHLGKVDNCVVTVHLGYARGDFQCLLDGDLFLPESWSEDRERCREAHIPDDVVYRPKWQIALEQYDRAVAKGLRFDWLTFDEYYGSKPEFLRALTGRQQHYVAEVPKSTVGWLTEPGLTSRPRGSGRGRRASKPRLLAGTPPARRLDTLLKRHPQLRDQAWQAYRIDDREQGPSVWQAKHALLWIKDENGLPATQPVHVIVARHVLREGDVKFFLSNAPVQTPVAKLLLVALTRHKVERCFQDPKSEMGLSHYEGRNYQGLIRHLILCSVSYFFLAKAKLSRAEKKPGVDRMPTPQGDRGADQRHLVLPPRAEPTLGKTGRGNPDNPAEQRQGSTIASETHTRFATSPRDQTHPSQTLSLVASLAL